MPPLKEEIVAGAIGRNFVSRDLLEATGVDDALLVHEAFFSDMPTRMVGSF